MVLLLPLVQPLNWGNPEEVACQGHSGLQGHSRTSRLQPVCRCVEMGEASLAEGTALAKPKRQGHAACGLAVRSRMKRGVKEAGAWPRHVKCLEREGGGDRSHLGLWYPLGRPGACGGCRSEAPSSQGCPACPFSICRVPALCQA